MDWRSPSMAAMALLSMANVWINLTAMLVAFPTRSRPLIYAGAALGLVCVAVGSAVAVRQIRSRVPAGEERAPRAVVGVNLAVFLFAVGLLVLGILARLPQ